LDRVLKSIVGFVDEIIVVDTGSVDQSIEICKRYGAIVYKSPWRDDFSFHRNESLAHASGHWLLVIDADEQLVFETQTPKQFKEQLFNLPSDCNAAGILFKDIQKDMVIMQSNPARFFRKGKVFYKDINHNQAQIKNSSRTIFLQGAFIKHFGYDLTPEEQAKKDARLSSGLMKRIMSNPNDYMAYFYLNQFHAARRDFENAVKFGEKYFEYKAEADRCNSFMTNIYYTMARSYMHLSNAKKTFEWIRMGAQALPKDIDIARCIVEFGSWQNQKTMVVEGAENFLRLYNEYQLNPALKANRFVYSLSPEALAFVLFNLVKFTLHDVSDNILLLKQTLYDTQPGFQAGMENDFMDLLEQCKQWPLQQSFAHLDAMLLQEAA